MVMALRCTSTSRDVGQAGSILSTLKYTSGLVMAALLAASVRRLLRRSIVPFVSPMLTANTSPCASNLRGHPHELPIESYTEQAHCEVYVQRLGMSVCSSWRAYLGCCWKWLRSAAMRAVSKLSSACLLLLFCCWCAAAPALSDVRPDSSCAAAGGSSSVMDWAVRKPTSGCRTLLTQTASASGSPAGLDAPRLESRHLDRRTLPQLKLSPGACGC